MCGFAPDGTSSTFLLAEEYGYSDWRHPACSVWPVSRVRPRAPVTGRRRRRTRPPVHDADLVDRSGRQGPAGFGMHHLPAFIVGILLFDFGVQAAHITNQNRIYGLHPDERNRLTTRLHGDVLLLRRRHKLDHRLSPTTPAAGSLSAPSAPASPPPPSPFGPRSAPPPNAESENLGLRKWWFPYFAV